MSRTVKVIIIALAALIVIAVCAVAAILIIRAIVTPEPTAVAPTTAATVETGVDDSWDRVKEAGKIVVGTSADYPPFEFYTGEFQIDGFDIALMDEIGRRLGVQVEYRDMAFDGLGPALELKQVDAAIAAISVTSEREAFVDFTNVYLVGEDGVLAREDSTVSIDSVGNLAELRLGVQRGSVYEDWLQTELVDTGTMSPDNLFVYERAEDAVRDLTEGRLDLVVMDSQPAEVAVAGDGVKIVGRGLNQQRYALALPNGAQALKAEIDGVLTDLHNEGFIAQLAKQYLGVTELLPTPTPAPTSTPAPPPACIDGLTFVEHAGEMGSGTPEMKPGQKFTKVWRVMNSGTCTWDGSYRVVFVSGNNPAASMGGQPTAVQGQVAPGELYDIKVDMVAPLKAGSYQAIWQMENGQDQAFGDRLSVRAKVLAAPTATPAPTQTPVAGIMFTVDRTNIKEGECVVFSWKVDNVKAVYFYAEGQRWQDSGVTGEGSQRECPPVTLTYYLRVVKRDNTVEIPQITIYVEPVTDAPDITRFTVDPPNQITLGQCVDIRWKVEGSVDRVTISANGGPLWDNAPLSGRLENCPDTTGSIGYGIEAVGPGGTSRQQQNIKVVDPATATPQPTAAPDMPVIYSFSVSPNQVEAGGCVGIAWSAGGGTANVRLLRNGDVVLSDAGLRGQETDCLDATGDYVYRLEAWNVAGNSVYEDRSVSVSEGAPENPLAGTRWQATALSGQPVLQGTTLTAAFGVDGSLNGSAGCNTYSSRYLADGSLLSILPPSLTSQLCTEPDGIMEQETSYLAALQSAGSFSMEAGQLYILDINGQALVEFGGMGQ